MCRRGAGAYPARTDDEGRRAHRGGGPHDERYRDRDITGTRDKDYDLVRYVEACPSNVLRPEQYVQDAERDKDNEAVELFRKAQSDSREGAEPGRELPRSRLGGG